MRLCLFGILLCICFNIKAQFFLCTAIDTLKATYRIGGRLDSLDAQLGQLSSTIPGGTFDLINNLITPSFIFKLPGGQRFYGFDEFKKPVFAGIPHLGFSYSFGSNGNQYLRTEYRQSFKPNVLLNVEYQNSKSAGITRSSAFSHHFLTLQLLKSGKYVSFDFKAKMETSNVNQCGGIISDSLLNLYSLDLIPVKKPNAVVKTKRFKLLHTNYLNLFVDSNKSMGIFSNHELFIKKYNYRESDSLVGLAGSYSLINYDSSFTVDQHQWSQFSNGMGLFSLSKQMAFKSGIQVNYWTFQNKGNTHDTLELLLWETFRINKSRFSIDNQFTMNLIGAKHELSNRFIATRIFTGFNANLDINYENKLPDFYQRYAYGNNYVANPANIQKQQRFNALISINRTIGKIPIWTKYGYYKAKNNYFFSADRWRNDVLPMLIFHQFIFRTELSLKSFHFQPSYQLTISEKSTAIIPRHVFLSRIFLKKALFKARKMESYLGFEWLICSSYQRIGYTPIVSAFDFVNFSAVQTGYTNAHLFAGFQIDEFRFFLRLENLGYFWNKPQINLLSAYPIVPLQFKVGLTWDFFN